jgi:hypothetical protein
MGSSGGVDVICGERDRDAERYREK